MDVELKHDPEVVRVEDHVALDVLVKAQKQDRVVWQSVSTLPFQIQGGAISEGGWKNLDFFVTG